MKKILSPSDPHPETPFWHSFWHTIWKCIWHIYSEILFDILSGIYFDFLFGIYSDILRGKATREWLLLLVEYETILFGAYLKAYVIIYVCIYIYVIYHSSTHLPSNCSWKSTPMTWTDVLHVLPGHREKTDADPEFYNCNSPKKEKQVGFSGGSFNKMNTIELVKTWQQKQETRAGIFLPTFEVWNLSKWRQCHWEHCRLVPSAFFCVHSQLDPCWAPSYN